MSQTKNKLKIMIQGYWGTNDTTKAVFPFDHANALVDAGHEVKIFLVAEATFLMRKHIAENCIPIGWPPVYDAMKTVSEKGVEIFPCHTCSAARGINEEDLKNFNASWGSAEKFVELVEWADKVLTL